MRHVASMGHVHGESPGSSITEMDVYMHARGQACVCVALACSRPEQEINK